MFLSVFFVFLFLIPSSVAVLFEDTILYRYQYQGYSPNSWLLTIIYGFLFILITTVVAANVTSLSDFVVNVTTCRDRIMRSKSVRTIDLAYLVIFYVLPVASLGYLLLRFGGANYAEYMVDRIVARKGLGFIIMPSTWLTISIAAALFSVFIGLKRKISLIIILPMLVFFVYAQLFLGSKSRGLIVVVYTVLAWAFFISSKSKFNHKPIVIIPSIAVVIAAVGLFFGDLREATTREVDLSSVETRVAVGSLFSKFNAFGAIENTLWLSENMSFNETIGGKSFLAVLVGAVPRAIWPEKPVGGGPELRNLIHPGSYDLNNGFQLSSYSPGIIAESYMNFGVIGFLLIAPLYGLLIGGIARFSAHVTTPLFFVTYVIVLYRSTYMLTGEVFGSVAGLFMTVLPIILYVGVRSIIFGSRNKPGKFLASQKPEKPILASTQKSNSL